MKQAFFFVLLIWTLCPLWAKTQKVIYIVTDGIPADYIERLQPPTIFEIAGRGNYARAYTGGEIGRYSQTPTISAIGYTNILTGTWMNKHNVNGNSNLHPNYNYWTIFRVAKEQKKEYTTALFSSWTDNRTVLIGEGLEETSHLKIDYVYDGYDLDKDHFPEQPGYLQVYDIDSVVCKRAAECVREKAPDLSWVYLWYTDAGFHKKGNSTYMDEYVMKTDQLIAQIWKAVKYRETHYDEEWMVIITTDHGRTENGHEHGGQSERERTVWISTNIQSVNPHFFHSSLSLVDIHPSICSFMHFDVPLERRFEWDGLSFIGKTDIYDLRLSPFNQQMTLEWKCMPTNEKATVYMALSNHFKEGGTDQWIKVAEVKAQTGKAEIDLSAYPPSMFYKFVVATKNNHLNRWYILKDY